MFFNTYGLIYVKFGRILKSIVENYAGTGSRVVPAFFEAVDSYHLNKIVHTSRLLKHCKLIKCRNEFTSVQCTYHKLSVRLLPDATLKLHLTLHPSQTKGSNENKPNHHEGSQLPVTYKSSVSQLTIIPICVEMDHFVNSSRVHRFGSRSGSMCSYCCTVAVVSPQN